MGLWFRARWTRSHTGRRFHIGWRFGICFSFWSIGRQRIRWLIFCVTIAIAIFCTILNVDCYVMIMAWRNNYITQLSRQLTARWSFCLDESDRSDVLAVFEAVGGCWETSRGGFWISTFGFGFSSDTLDSDFFSDSDSSFSRSKSHFQNCNF